MISAHGAKVVFDEDAREEELLRHLACCAVPTSKQEATDALYDWCDGRLLFDADRQMFNMLSEDGVWDCCTDAYVRTTVAQPYARALASAARESGSKAAVRFASSLSCMGFAKELAEALKDRYAVPSSMFDRDNEVIGVANGVYSLRERRLLEDLWDDVPYVSLRAGGRVTDGTEPDGWGDALEAAKAEWQAFVDAMCASADGSPDTDKSAYLKRAMGCCAYGRNPEKVMFLLWGESGNNGKSTFLNCVVKALGEYATNTQPSILLKGMTRESETSPNQMLMDCIGKRFVAVSETPANSTFDTQRFRRLTGNDPFPIRGMYQRKTTLIEPMLTMMYACNDKPSVDDTASFDTERFRVIALERSFSRDETDRDLETRLTCDEAHLSAILAWVLEGAAEYAKQGLAEPLSVQFATDDYRSDNDTVAGFAEDRMERKRGERVRASSVYTAYVRWCNTHGMEPVGNRKFPKLMSELGYERTTDRSKYIDATLSAPFAGHK